MKLHKKITVAGELYKIVDEDVRLALLSPGKAVFTLQAETTLSGIVIFAFGYDPDKLQQWFMGYVETSTPIDGQQQRIMCRELSATLNRPLPLSLRNTTLNQTLEAISADSGLDFVTADQQYSITPAPVFYSIGGGYHCMDSLAEVYDIPQLLWQQQGDGKVYVGSWSDSFWSSRPIELPVEWKTKQGVADRAGVPALPKLRPGVLMNETDYLTQVQFAGNHMQLTWSKNPWSTR